MGLNYNKYVFTKLVGLSHNTLEHLTPMSTCRVWEYHYLVKSVLYLLTRSRDTHSPFGFFTIVHTHTVFEFGFERNPWKCSTAARTHGDKRGAAWCWDAVGESWAWFGYCCWVRRERERVRNDDGGRWCIKTDDEHTERCFCVDRCCVTVKWPASYFTGFASSLVTPPRSLAPAWWRDLSAAVSYMA